jgi:hypothetical protein
MQRPTSVTVFGILNIIFAVFGSLALVASIALLSVSAAFPNPMVRIMHENPSYAMWIKINIPLGLLSCASLLVAGIGLMKLKEWGRKLSLGYAIYALFMGVLGLVMNFFFLLRPLLQEAVQKQGPEAAGAIGGAVGGSVGGCLGMVYPVLLLIFLTRPKLVAAFQWSQEEATMPPLPPAL